MIRTKPNISCLLKVLPFACWYKGSKICLIFKWYQFTELSGKCFLITTFLNVDALVQSSSNDTKSLQIRRTTKIAETRTHVSVQPKCFQTLIVFPSIAKERCDSKRRNPRFDATSLVQQDTRLDLRASVADRWSSRAQAGACKLKASTRLYKQKLMQMLRCIARITPSNPFSIITKCNQRRQPKGNKSTEAQLKNYCCSCKISAIWPDQFAFTSSLISTVFTCEFHWMTLFESRTKQWIYSLK